MARKPVILRALADADVQRAIADYQGISRGTAARFIDRLEQVIDHLARHSESGSLRYAEALGLPGLRCWPCRQFPWLVFYVTTPARVELVRVLHTRQDIPDSLTPDSWGE